MGHFAVKIAGVASHDNPLIMRLARYFFETLPNRREAEKQDQLRRQAESEEWLRGLKSEVAQAQEKDRRQQIAGRG